MRLGLRSLDNRLRMDRRIGELGHNEPNVTSLSRRPYDILGGASVAVIWPEYTYPPFSPMLRDAEDVQRHRSAYVSSFRSIEALLMKPHSILGAATRIGDSLTFLAGVRRLPICIIFGKPAPQFDVPLFDKIRSHE